MAPTDRSPYLPRRHTTTGRFRPPIPRNALRHRCCCGPYRRHRVCATRLWLVSASSAQPRGRSCDSTAVSTSYLKRCGHDRGDHRCNKSRNQFGVVSLPFGGSGLDRYPALSDSRWPEAVSDFAKGGLRGPSLRRCWLYWRRLAVQEPCVDSFVGAHHPKLPSRGIR